MGWVRKLPPDHKCNPPSQTTAGLGSIWKCRKCKTMWRLWRKTVHPPYGIVISNWQELRQGEDT